MERRLRYFWKNWSTRLYTGKGRILLIVCEISTNLKNFTLTLHIMWNSPISSVRSRWATLQVLKAAASSEGITHKVFQL